MIAFLVRRTLVLALSLLAASLVVFLVLQVLPGDPAALILGVNARPDTLAALHRELGLDRPDWLRYLAWLRDLATGSLGRSYTYDVPVANLIAERLPVSLPLAAIAVLLATTLAIPVGVAAAARRGGAGDLALMAGSQIGMAIPDFWLGLLLILFFALRLAWLPASGFPGWAAGAWPGLRALLLPAIALALPQAAILARVTRSAVLETLQADYVRTARAKGLTRAAALWRHAVPNAMIPVVTIIGLQFSFLIAGTVIIENVFTLPGLGRLVFQAIEQRDLIVVQDLVVLLAGCVIAVNFLVDLVYAGLDPRLGRL
ncbi:MAG TPA: ABC transporter permease [Acetobacteraceae bacterium]|nr:ABC transporter permease [Acetobacteraceae bacterium]